MSGKKDTINVKSYMKPTYIEKPTSSAHELKLDANEMFLLLHYFCRWLPWFFRCWLRWFDDDVDCDDLMMMLIAMIWWWCWLRWCDDDVDGSDELWTKAATRATSLNISLSFPTNPSHKLHLHGWWWFDHHDNHLYFDDHMMAMISLISVIRWCKILKAVVSFFLYVLTQHNCFIIASANLEI